MTIRHPFWIENRRSLKIANHCITRKRLNYIKNEMK